jgi:hypothetical protein
VYWQPGQELKTRPYKIEETIGQGGFGVTYKARHLGLKHQVVLKTPNATLRNDPAYPRFEQRFLKEGQMLAQLSQKGHASIVRVSDLFTEITVRLWDVATGRELRQLTGHTDDVRSVAISADGQTLASGSDAPANPRQAIIPCDCGMWPPDGNCANSLDIQNDCEWPAWP